MPSPKNGVNDQWGLASSTGVRPNPPNITLTDGDGGCPLIDEEGRIWTRAIPGPPVPGASVAWQAFSGLVAEAQVRGPQSDPSDQYVLEQISGSLVAASPSEVNFVQIYESNGAPLGGPPVQTILVIGSQVWSWAPQRWRFVDGAIYLLVSTTPDTPTLSATAETTYNALGWESPP
jgi:hypothetical protein